MSKLIINRFLMAAAMVVTINGAYAASQTASISGTLGGWDAYNASSKSPVPYSSTSVGVDLFEGITVGYDKRQGYNTKFLEIPVTGSVTFDNETGVITALTLSQTADITGYYDVNSDNFTDDSFANGGDGGSLTVSGLQWVLDLNTGYLNQIAGSASGCESNSPICQFTFDGINTNNGTNSFGQSIFDFQGISGGFQTLPRSNASFNGYGTAFYKQWTALPGASLGTMNLTTGALTIGVASRLDAGSTTTNAANTAIFSLTGQQPQLTCTSGQYWNGSICVAADPGNYASGPGSVSQIACALGNYQPASGQSACLSADIGFYVDTTASPSQTACPGGQITDSTGSTSIADCKVPSGCTAGSYDNGSSCVLADPGNYVPNDGATTQQQCAPGTYQPNSGASSCLNADAGYFVANPGSSSKTACSSGSYQPNSNATQCLLASANFYVPSSAATAQIACPSTYVSQPGASICTLPPKPSDADGDGLLDSTEVLYGSNPLIVDTDADGILDRADPFPTNPAPPSYSASTLYSQGVLSIPSCKVGKRVLGEQLSFLNKNFTLQMGQSGSPVMLTFGTYKVVKSGQKYQLNLSANSKQLLQQQLDSWAGFTCGGNVVLTMATPKLELSVNKQKTQATLTLNAKVTTKLGNGKTKSGTYKSTATLALSNGAPK